MVNGCKDQESQGYMVEGCKVKDRRKNGQNPKSRASSVSSDSDSLGFF